MTFSVHQSEPRYGTRGSLPTFYQNMASEDTKYHHIGDGRQRKLQTGPRFVPAVQEGINGCRQKHGRLDNYWGNQQWLALQLGRNLSSGNTFCE